eukprot:1149496-Pelagomonas_calceolata.AAC.1
MGTQEHRKKACPVVTALWDHPEVDAFPIKRGGGHGHKDCCGVGRTLADTAKCCAHSRPSSCCKCHGWHAGDFKEFLTIHVSSLEMLYPRDPMGL